MNIKEFIAKLKEYPEDYEIKFQTSNMDSKNDKEIELKFLMDSEISKRLTLDFVKKSEKMKFRKTHVEVEAVQWTGRNKKELMFFLGENLGGSFFESVNLSDNDLARQGRPFDSLYIKTEIEKINFQTGDWIIKEFVDGQKIFSVKDDKIFKKMYERMGETNE